MHFRLRQDVESWFKHIKDEKPIKTMFDRYYLCFILGLAADRRSTPEKMCVKVSDIIDYFITEYRPYQRLITGLLVRAELSRTGIEITERKEISKFFIDYIEPNSPTQLTDLGMTKMNEYASGGFDYLTEQVHTQPYTIEEFLRIYMNIFRKAVEANINWKNILKSK